MTVEALEVLGTVFMASGAVIAPVVFLVKLLESF